MQHIEWRSTGLVLISVILLASCSNTALPTEVFEGVEKPEIFQSTIPVPVNTSYELTAEQPVGEQTRFSEQLGSQSLRNLNGTPYLEQNPNLITAQAVTKTRDEWLRKGTWTKTLNSASREVCRPPRSFAASVSGGYTLTISATGDIAVVKATGTLSGTVTLTAGITYSWTACAYFQKSEIERYQRWELWAYYSDGTSKWTGGVSNTRLPAQYGDVTDSRITPWTTR